VPHDQGNRLAGPGGPGKWTTHPDLRVVRYVTGGPPPTWTTIKEPAGQRGWTTPLPYGGCYPLVHPPPEGTHPATGAPVGHSSSTALTHWQRATPHRRTGENNPRYTHQKHRTRKIPLARGPSLVAGDFLSFAADQGGWRSSRCNDPKPPTARYRCGFRCRLRHGRRWVEGAFLAGLACAPSVRRTQKWASDLRKCGVSVLPQLVSAAARPLAGGPVTIVTNVRRRHG
jgi:hypothetical protein